MASAKHIAAAARAAFTEVRAAHPDERFYVFALFSESGDDLQPTSNTLEGLARTAKAEGSTEDALRWFAESFAYHQEGEAHFADLGARPAKKGLGPAVKALAELEKEGFFGKGKARDDVAVLVLRSDQANREVVDIARELNPPAVVKRIEAAFEVAASTGEPTTLGRDQAYSLDSLAASADGKTLAAAGWFGGPELYAFNLDKAPRALAVQRPKEAFRFIALSADGATLYGATTTSIVRLSTTSKTTRLPAIATDTARIDGFALSPDRTTLVATLGSTLERWSVAGDAVELTGSAPGLGLRSLVFTPDGKLLIALTGDGDLALVDAAKLTIDDTIVLRDTAARSVAASSNLVAVGSYRNDQPIRIFSLRKKDIVAELPPHRKDGVTALAFSPDGQKLASAGEDGHVRVWNLDNESLLADVRGRQEAMGAVLFLDDSHVAAAGRDTSKGPPIYVWKV